MEAFLRSAGLGPTSSPPLVARTLVESTHARAQSISSAFLQSGQNTPMELIPDPGSLPITQPSPAGHTAHPKNRGEQLPRNSAAQHTKDPSSVARSELGGPPSRAGCMRRQKRFNFLPQLIAYYRFHERTDAASTSISCVLLELLKPAVVPLALRSVLPRGGFQKRFRRPAPARESPLPP